MGYKGIYIVRDEAGKSLGRYPGWTGADAIKLAQTKHPNAKGLKATSTGEEYR